jgi:NADPH-dependent ferric siderophore reductase
MACCFIMPAAHTVTRTGRFEAEVGDLITLSPRMRRIVLRAPALATQHWPLACDVAVVLGGPDGREMRRRYTVRRSRGEELLLDAVLHGHGPGSTWAATLRPGDLVTFFGPRGEISAADTDWLLALTDESGLPAIAALAESLGKRPITVLAEIADDGERYPLPANAEARWLARAGEPAGGTAVLAAGLAGFTPPPGRGHAYVIGESRAVVALRESLAGLGLGRADVYAKGYWNLNARPTR